MKVILADRVLAGPELDRIDRGAVVVDGTHIAFVGREADVSAELLDDESRVQRLGDVTLLPGLIDSHVHLGFDGGPTPVARMMAESDTQQVMTMLLSARQLLSAGVTTARDLGARCYLDVDVRDAIAAGTARGPRMLTAGGAITVTGGHCWFMGAEVDSVADMRRMVREHHKAGVNVIKVMSTGGNMTPGSAPWHAQFTTEELRVAVEEAHRLSHRVAAHAHGVEGIRRALDAGVDTLEHCSFQTEDGFGGVDPELADRIAAADVYVSPTCNLRMPEIRRLMPDREFALGELYRRGATIIASTDSGIDNTPHHGFVGGLEAMAEFGMSAKEVLHAATTTAARALDLSDVTGQLTAGHEADLIAVEGDPLADLGVLRSLVLVMTRGTEFVPDELPPIEPLSLDSWPALAKRVRRADLEGESAGAAGGTTTVDASAVPAGAR